MSDTPELDRVADARRALSAHAGFPRTYWALYGVALVLMAGIPIWVSLLPAGAPYVSWVLLAVAVASALYSVLRRRRTGVQLPRRIGAYPSARLTWLAVLALSAAGLLGIYALVGAGQRGAAFVALAAVAVVTFLGQIRVRTLMRADIAAGRVAP